MDLLGNVDRDVNLLDVVNRVRYGHVDLLDVVDRNMDRVRYLLDVVHRIGHLLHVVMMYRMHVVRDVNFNVLADRKKANFFQYN